MSGAAFEKWDRPDSNDFSESEDEDAARTRTSEDVRLHDNETLAAEEEAERLLSGQENGSRFGKLFTSGDGTISRDERRQRRRDGRREKRRRRRRRKGEKSELMYDMEGGRRSSEEESSGNSSEVDMQRLAETQAKRKTSKKARFCAFAAVHSTIIGVFVLFVYGAYNASSYMASSKTSTIAKTLSNGTHTFAPTTLLLSLDGFRADFLTRNLTPTLNSFIRSGVSPKYMLPSFPSLTFPNHFTLVTGLYPESHGVVGNTFRDPSTQKEFFYTDPDRSMQPEWWNAEPLWLTAELAGLKTAIHMWPGSEAHIGSMEPAYVDEFNGKEKLSRKVERILHWLDMPGAEDERESVKNVRPQLIAAYVPNVDADGHKYGPNSTYIRSTIKEVDGMLSAIFRGIDERNLTDIVNIIVVSDHGMATTSVDRLIQLEEIIDTKLIEHTDGWPLYGLRPFDHSDAHLQKLYNGLVAKSKLPQYQHAFDVYLRDKDMPARYHFTNNNRIAPLWIVPKAGWAIVTKDEFNIAEAKKKGLVYMPRGLHGYDHEHPLMRAIFVARGPAFPHPKGSQMDVFQNTEVYNIVCDSLGIEQKANNGTLRLPLKPKGRHDFENQVIDVPDDPQGDLNVILPPMVPNLNEHKTKVLTPVVPEAPTAPAVPNMPKRPTVPDRPTAPKRPVVHDGEDDEPKDFNHWWEWVKGKLDGIKWWASEAMGWKSEQEPGKNGTNSTAG